MIELKAEERVSFFFDEKKPWNLNFLCPTSELIMISTAVLYPFLMALVTNREDALIEKSGTLGK
jgi:hypothetical protein